MKQTACSLIAAKWFRESLPLSGGWLFLIVSLSLVFVFAALYYIVKMVHIRKKLERENSLLREEAAALKKQRNLHFFNNTLASIRYLCTSDPAGAVQLIGEFSDYLHGIYQAPFPDRPVPFAWELDQIRHYLYIEKVRFDTALNIEYDIQFTEFQVPPLALLSLVENAVKHGITRKKGGGTLFISTFQTESEIQITITDNGIGFTPVQRDPAGKHTGGLEIVRRRFELLCSAALYLESTPGEGTRVFVVIPKGDKTA